MQAGSPYRESVTRRPPSPPERSFGAQVVDVGMGLLVTVAAVALVFAMMGDVRSASQRWTFSDATESVAELGLTLSSIAAGEWTIESDDRATGGVAMVSRAGESGARAAMAIAPAAGRDVRAATRCRTPVAAQSAACGMVFRFQDHENHYLARLDGAKRSVELVLVREGTERLLGSAHAAFSPEVWQELAVEARGGHLYVNWNGARVIDARDPTFRGGGVGLWAPADGVAHFDVLEIESVRVPRAFDPG